jgi:HemY protein
VKKIACYFLILLAAVWFGIIMRDNSGQILISYGGVVIESSFWFGLLFVVLLFLLFHLLLRYGSKVGSLVSSVRGWLTNHRSRRAHAQTVLAMYDLIEGNFSKAEKRFSHYAKYSNMALINYLAAAAMAQQQQAINRQERYLLLAQQIEGDHSAVVAMVRAQLAVKNNLCEEAVEILRQLRIVQPKNALVLGMLRDLYVKNGCWHELHELLPALRKHGAMDSDDFIRLEQQVYEKLLVAAVQNGSIDDLWGAVPQFLQKNPSLVAIYVKYLLDNRRIEEAEIILKMVLRKQLDAKLLELYATMDSQEPLRHLARAESWLEKQPQHAELLLALGRICRRQKLWGKARKYLERSIKLSYNREAYRELADFFAEQADLPKATALYRRAFRSLQ